MWYIPFIAFGIFFVIFLAIIISGFKTHKRTTDTIKNVFTTVSTNIESEIQKAFEPQKEETRTCDYCGSSVSVASLKCDSCGAKIKSKK